MDPATIAIYQERAEEWRQARAEELLHARPEELRPGSKSTLEQALALGQSRIGPGPVLDLGCGPGFHLSALGSPAVALDAAPAMVAMATTANSTAFGVVADLAQLPFRFASASGGWASASYLHIERTALPQALADLHQTLVPNAPAAMKFRRGSNEGLLTGLTDEQFSGRFFAEWEPIPLRDVLEGAGFSVDYCQADSKKADSKKADWIEVRATRAATLPDFVGPKMKVLICGLNPSVYSTETGVGFSRPGNRFWPAALQSGLATRDRDPRHALQVHGIGMTDLVKRATVKAAEVESREYENGMERVGRLVKWLQPKIVCFVGLAGYRQVVNKKAQCGQQPELLGGVPVYLMPSTSGLNANYSLKQLTDNFIQVLEMSDSK